MTGRHTPATPTRRTWSSVESTARLDAVALARAVQRQHPELWRRWLDTDEAVVCRVAVPLTRDGAPASLGRHGPHCRLPAGAAHDHADPTCDGL